MAMVELAPERPVGGQGTVGAEEPGPQVAGLALAPLLAAPPNDPAPCEVPMPCLLGEAPAPCVVLGFTDPLDCPVWATAMLPPAIIATAAAAAEQRVGACCAKFATTMRSLRRRLSFAWSAPAGV